MLNICKLICFLIILKIEKNENRKLNMFNLLVLCFLKMLLKIWLNVYIMLKVYCVIKCYVYKFCDYMYLFDLEDGLNWKFMIILVLYIIFVVKWVFILLNWLFMKFLLGLVSLLVVLCI